MIGVGLSIVQLAVRQLLGFNPRSLFANGEQGAWYDPSDRNTLFQDSAGTQPVTAVEQPVGLILDKSKGLVLGPELVTNGDFSNGLTGFTTVNGATNSVTTASAVGIADNGGGNIARTVSNGSVSGFGASISTVSGRGYKMTFALYGVNFASSAIYVGTTVSSNNVLSNLQPGTASENAWQTVSVYFVAASSTTYITFCASQVSGRVSYFDNISIRELPGNHAFQATSTSRPVLSARYNLLLNTETLATQSVTTAATTQRLRFEGTGSITLSGTAAGTYSAGSHTFSTTAGTLTLTVTGSVTKADLRASNDAAGQPAYQRVNTATDYDTTGFKPYLRFDGTDDSLQTNSIDFSATDKMTVFAGVRKLSDAAQGTPASTFTGSNNGVFEMSAPGSGLSGEPYGLRSRGTINAFASASAGFGAPITNVITGIGDISGDSAILRVNGTQVASSTVDQGTGNYLAYPLYIGRRGGTTLPFNGRIYGLIVRGAQSTAQQITNTENWLNQRTGAY